MKKQCPDVVVVKKGYPKTRTKQKNKSRKWKLKHLDVKEAEKNGMFLAFGCK